MKSDKSTRDKTINRSNKRPDKPMWSNWIRLKIHIKIKSDNFNKNFKFNSKKWKRFLAMIRIKCCRKWQRKRIDLKKYPNKN